MPLTHKVTLGLAGLILSSCVFASPYVVTANGDLSVEKGQIVNQKGKAVAFAGPSFFWSNNGWGGEIFYSRQTVAWAKNNWQATLIRAAMGIEGNGGYLKAPEANKQRVFDIVDAAIAEDMYVLVDWHDHHGQEHTQLAVEFFTEVAKRYGKNPHVIYEIYNEPKNATWLNQVKPYALTVIKAIRAHDPDNLIVVGTPNWSQDVDIAAVSPILETKNIVYALHFYAGSHKQNLRNKAKKALDAGIALMVTEWGTVNADGNGNADVKETQLWMEFMRKYSLSHCNWAISAKNEGASIFKPDVKPAANYADTQLTTSGLIARQWVRSWYDLSLPGAQK